MSTASGGSLGTADELHENAARRTGLDDFGDQGYREALEVLLESYRTDAGLTEQGVRHARALVRTVLESRLRAVRSFNEHPEYLSARVRRPVFVTGLPRTGTTALHRLLCVDPMSQGLEHWLTEAPQPRPPRRSWPDNPDFQRMRHFLDDRHAASPQMRGMHFMAADMVEECWRIERLSMLSIGFENVAHLPMYSRWLEGRSRVPGYEMHRDVLRLIGLGDPDRRWTLKSPSHLFGLDDLMKVYPDALVIQTHRDPRTIIASVSSLIRAATDGNSTVFTGNRLGRGMLELWSRGAAAFREARKRYDAAQFIDVHYEEFVRDAVGVVESIYDRSGLELDAETRAAIENSHAESKVSERRPAHHYDLDEFGLTRDEVTERFTGYLAEFFPAAA